MKIALGADHAGVEAKDALVDALRAAGHEPVDLGTRGAASVDYPDYALRVAQEVASGRCDRGVLVCGTGIGMAMTANHVAGIRAAQIYDATMAEMSRRHNDANVACFGARLTPAEEMRRLLSLWLETPFEGGRHAPRVAKIQGARS